MPACGLGLAGEKERIKKGESSEGSPSCLYRIRVLQRSAWNPFHPAPFLSRSKGLGSAVLRRAFEDLGGASSWPCAVQTRCCRLHERRGGRRRRRGSRRSSTAHGEARCSGAAAFSGMCKTAKHHQHPQCAPGTPVFAGTALRLNWAAERKQRNAAGRHRSLFFDGSTLPQLCAVLKSAAFILCGFQPSAKQNRLKTAPAPPRSIRCGRPDPRAIPNSGKPSAHRVRERRRRSLRTR